MTSIAFDSHVFIKRLVASGMPETQAEVVTNLVREAQEGAADAVATKGDIALVRRDLEQVEAELRRDMAEMKADLLKWMFGALAAQTAFLSAIKFFGH